MTDLLKTGSLFQILARPNPRESALSCQSSEFDARAGVMKTAKNGANVVFRKPRTLNKRF